MSAGTTLVLFTASFPFGLRTESFLENELPILANRFDRVLVLPSHRKEARRALPQGVELVEMPWLDGWNRWMRLRAAADRQAIGLIASIARVPKDWIPYGRGLRVYTDVVGQAVLKARQLSSFIKGRALSEACFYDYWFENTTLALAILRAAGDISLAVARAHRFDLYDEEWPAGRVPFRDFKLKQLDAVYPVSDFGREYLIRRAPWAAERVHVQRLGVQRRPLPDPRPDADIPLVVSCGTLLPRKRFDLVPEVLERCGRPLRWVHFGNGPDASRVRAAAQRLSEKIIWDLRGDVSNHEIIQFYEQNPVNAFISMSVSEGLPVSMMEAISFGIPVVGIGVHGVPEIVTPQTGICLRPDATTREAAFALSQVLTQGRFDRASIREFFTTHFDAAVNYTEFANRLLALRHDIR